MGMTPMGSYCVNCGVRSAGVWTKMDGDERRGPFCWDCAMQPLDSERERGRFKGRLAVLALLRLPAVVQLTRTEEAAEGVGPERPSQESGA